MINGWYLSTCVLIFCNHEVPSLTYLKVKNQDHEVNISYTQQSMHQNS